jgi:hypothetical protein
MPSSSMRPLRSPRSGIVDANIRRMAAAVILGAVVAARKADRVIRELQLSEHGKPEGRAAYRDR